MRLSRFFPISAALALAVVSSSVHAQEGFPGSLRSYNDHHKLHFKIGTAVVLNGGGGGAYHAGILTKNPGDLFLQNMVRTQFGQIEPENELKMQNVWTGGAQMVNGKYAAVTNILDPTGPLSQLCTWAESEEPRMTVRGHVMVYNPGYTIPRFLTAQPATGGAPGPNGFGGGFGPRAAPKLNPDYTANDLRDMLESYVRQVVDGTMVQNAISRTKYNYKVVEMWDVTNEVVNDNTKSTQYPGAGFAFRSADFWYSNGPSSSPGLGYDYVPDVYFWATDEMTKNVGKTIDGQQISKKDGFELYYNDYNLEWSADKTAEAFNLIQHARSGGGRVDGLGIQGHINSSNPLSPLFETTIKTAIANHLHFAITEMDCAINEDPRKGSKTVAEQEVQQGENYGAVAALCVKYQKNCDCLQIWGASDDASWLPNQEATPFTGWVLDTRDGATKGKSGYWPKEGQFDPFTMYDNYFGGPDTTSGHNVSDAYDEMLSAFSGKPVTKSQ